MSTAHIAALPGQIAPKVIMPGDPYRARRIAETRLDDPTLVTDVRGILGYTGTYRGEPLTVMASGMGSPSMTIYATELARFYGVRDIVRVGTAGGIHPSVEVRDIVIATAAHTDSAMSASRIPGIVFSHVPDFTLASAAVGASESVEATVHTGAVFTSDHFYATPEGMFDRLAAHGALAVEMEAAGLYAVGAAEHVRTLTVLTVTDVPATGVSLSSHERETSFDAALELALAALR
ncbi:purine-nucleoside phosphorylase [Microbacterium sp. cx-55]|uniref:purine-nucleoside phosphorylase n=1 Tax=unclassified Microbacterium TaxID=2609290 RepID=UPI001CBCE228|nr:MULTISPECIES: purine-nucleoside phosphorylase [unclassified Microbacterium]MBZ4488047.1 purine-nucleoside phosphorylase [Microbacterium sp. cx-55]MCC4908921.1 purine-nucleoside phosphorylase [Microbacterium sp. cx-59]UGB34547.1 purine-nucleoside phosphorylase [Microbacterium sp. cx-55]